jgi:hypothetical protein
MGGGRGGGQRERACSAACSASSTSSRALAAFAPQQAVTFPRGARRRSADATQRAGQTRRRFARSGAATGGPASGLRAADGQTWVPSPRTTAGKSAGRSTPAAAPTMSCRANLSALQVRLVRGEGRRVSDLYGVRDATCPVSTEGGGARSLDRRALEVAAQQQRRRLGRAGGGRGTLLTKNKLTDYRAGPRLSRWHRILASRYLCGPRR